MIWKAANKLPRQSEPKTTNARNIPWAIPALVAAVVLVAAVLIFSATGPDRSHTADYKERNPIPYSSNSREPAGPRQNTEMPTTIKARCGI